MNNCIFRISEVLHKLWKWCIFTLICGWSPLYFGIIVDFSMTTMGMPLVDSAVAETYHVLSPPLQFNYANITKVT